MFNVIKVKNELVRFTKKNLDADSWRYSNSGYFDFTVSKFRGTDLDMVHIKTYPDSISLIVSIGYKNELFVTNATRKDVAKYKKLIKYLGTI